jgi:hypothetical protein
MQASAGEYISVNGLRLQEFVFIGGQLGHGLSRQLLLDLGI